MLQSTYFVFQKSWTAQHMLVLLVLIDVYQRKRFIPCPEIHRGHFCVLLSIHIATTGLDEQEIHVFGTMSSYLCNLCFLIEKWPVQPVGRSVTLALLIRSCCTRICIRICIYICICICITDTDTICFSICICICVSICI